MADAAALAGSSLRAFGLDASEMERVVSVLAVATTKTALDFGFLQTAMATIAPVANAFGFSIEDSTALLGQLANAGFDASSAATATRNILLNLADANGALAKELGRPITSADDLAGALIELKDKGIDLATALELTDKRSVAAFETFLNGSDSLVELRDSITGVSGELDEMSAKKLDTISGATDLLKSAWEGLVLEWNEGAGAGEALKKAIVFLSKNLKTILKVMGTGIKIFVALKIASKLYRLETDKLGKSIAVGLIPRFKTMITGLFASAKAFKFSSISVKGFGTALKSIPFTQILTFFAIVVPLVWDWVGALFAAKEEVDHLSASEEVLQEVSQKTSVRLVEEQAGLKAVFLALKNTTNGTDERQEALDRVNEKYGTTLKNLSDEAAFVTQIDLAYRSLLETLKDKIRLEVVQEKLTELLKKQLIAEDELLRQQDDLIKKRLDAGITEKLIQVSALGEPLKFETVLVDKEGNIIDDDSFLLTQLGIDVAGTEIDFIQQKIDALLSKNEGALDAILGGDVTAGGVGGGGGVSKAIDEEQIKLDKLNALRKRNELILLEGEKKLIQRGVDKEQRDFILSQKRIELMRKESELIVELDFRDKGILIKQENAYFKFIEANQIKRVDVHKDANDDIEEDAKLMFKELEKQPPKFLDILGEAFNTLRDEIAETARLLAKLGENRLVQLDAQHDAEQRNFDESKSREQELKDLAKEKGLDASESIRVERENQKAALEAQRKIAEEKAKTTALLALVTAWAAQVQSGQGNPVANVKASFNDLKGFVEGSFYTGTEHTLADALGGTGTRDGHIIRADDNEAIFTGQQTSDLGIHKGGNSTQDIVNMYKGGILGASVRGGMGVDVKTMPTQNNKELIREVKKLVSNTNPANQKSDGTTFNVLTGMLEKQRRNGGKIRYQTRN
jgi:hypothetical protein